MDFSLIKKLYETGVVALDERRLSAALTGIRQMLSALNYKAAPETFSELCHDYQLMVKYMSEGYADPDRHQLYLHFIQRGYELYTTLFREATLQRDAPTTHYATLWRTLQYMQGPHNMADLLGNSPSYRQLFEITYTSCVWDDTTYAQGKEILRSRSLSTFDQCVMISALTLATLDFFDRKKILLLFDVLDTPSNPACQIRVMVALLLLCIKYSRRWEAYPDILHKYQSLDKNHTFIHALRDIQVQLLLSRETQEIEKSLQEEIIPDMMKQAKQFKLNKKLGTEMLNDAAQQMEQNPEWNKHLSDSAWSRKLHKLIDMQQKGADIFMGSFRMFKQKFPFFSAAANWFCPFDIHHPEIEKIIREKTYIQGFINNANLCDSDKYSFSFMFAGIPAAQNAMLQKQLQENGLSEEMLSGQAVDDSLSKDSLLHLCRSYIQDLYRYFKLFHPHEQIADPFKLDLLFINTPLLKRLLNHEDLKLLGDFSFSEKHYPEARKFYELLEPSAEIYQKIGFCHQIAGKYAEAIQSYDRANLLGADDAWAMRQMADCYRRTGKYAKALQYYTELEKRNSEDCNNLIRIGECLICEGRYEEALPKLFKADYLDETTGNALRPLAWCLLSLNRMEEAQSYYQKILNRVPSATDFLNAGHVAWIQGNVKGAITLYRQSMQASSITSASLHFFSEDAELLQKHAILHDDLCIMVDILNGINLQDLSVAEIQ